MWALGGFILFSLALAACQGEGVLFPPAGQTPPATPGAPTPSPFTPLLSPTPEPTLTPLPHLLVDPAQLNGVDVAFWHPWTGELADLVESLANEFNRSNEWNITVLVRETGSSEMLNEQVAAALDSDEHPQVVVAPVEQLQAWRERSKAVLNLNDYISDPQWGLSAAEVADFPVVFLEQDRVDGRLLGIPARRTTQIMFYNQTWAQELGFDEAPETLDDFRQQVCAAASANVLDTGWENNGTGGWILNTSPDTLLTWMAAFGVEDLAGLGQERYRFNVPPVQDMLAYQRELFDSDCAWNSRLPDPYDYFATRQALLYTGRLEDIPLQARAMQRAENEDSWTVIPFPSDEQGTPVVTTGESYALLAGSPEEQLAAWLFVRWMAQAEHQVEFVKRAGGWPVQVSATDELAGYRRQYPQWGDTLLWIPLAQPAPQAASWRIARNVLQDAAWQVFQANATPDDISTYLQEADRLIPEVLEENP
jgi:multiple sugar transport system substrate-binding protein